MILALNTSTPTCLLSVYDGAWYDADWEAGRDLADQLLTHIGDLLIRRNGADVHALEGIIVYEGPGSYTGLRIGLTVANTLAQSLSIPIVGTTDESWREKGFGRLQAGQNDHIVMPVYGGQPNITTPRK